MPDRNSTKVPLRPSDPSCQLGSVTTSPRRVPLDRDIHVSDVMKAKIDQLLELRFREVALYGLRRRRMRGRTEFRLIYIGCGGGGGGGFGGRSNGGGSAGLCRQCVRTVSAIFSPPLKASSPFCANT